MTKVMRLRSPSYKPRGLFLPLHNRKTHWSIGVAHRRAGKTVAHINELLSLAAKCKLERPRLAYIAPQLNQA